MNIEKLLAPPLDKLITLGDAHQVLRFPITEIPNYAKDLDLGSEHIPRLIELIKKWPEIWKDEAIKNDVVLAPVYAFIILGNLRAIEAIEPILSTLNSMELVDNDWYLELVPRVFEMIGPPAIEPCNNFLKNRENLPFPPLLYCELHAKNRSNLPRI
jgi:hypothetical protein